MFQIGTKPKPSEKPEPAKAADAERPAKPHRLLSVTVRLSAAQKERLAALGGDEWLRQQIDAAELEGDVKED